MPDRVHIDEKWCFFKKSAARCIKAEEGAAHLTTTSKGRIMKLMSLVAVARPRLDSHRKTLFDGRVGCWPFVKCVPAKKTSKYMRSGTVVTSSLSARSAVYERFQLDNLLPEFITKWPGVFCAFCFRFLNFGFMTWYL